MIYSTLRSCLIDLESKNMLVKIEDMVDGSFEAAEMQRQIFEANGPALWFQRIKGSPFTAVSNLYSTQERAEYIFSSALKNLEGLSKLKADPGFFLRAPFQSMKAIIYARHALPRKAWLDKGVLANQCRLEDIPQIISWPDDGGAFITLPQVISFPPNDKSPAKANVGMYRIQISGNDYQKNTEAGLHYQLHRGIGIHHTQYLESDQSFKVSIAVGGPPAYTLASIFPLPEGLSEILFSGILNGRSYRYNWVNNYFIPIDTDFCITGVVETKKLKREGPFGDHLGYYSLEHPFPYIKIDKVYHRKDPIFHFTVVGRPPQEDSWFGYLIHNMVKPLTSNEFPGVREIHAVDEAGVHPLLLAIGSERYMPFRDKKPEEILTQANHLLGKGQTSLAKYLIIAAFDSNIPSAKNVMAFLHYVLERVDWNYDLHYITNTTIDTLDYSGHDWNGGSKLIIACNRNPLRKLATSCSLSPYSIITNFLVFAPGILLIEFTSFISYEVAPNEINQLEAFLQTQNLEGIALIILCDNLNFIKTSAANFIWTVFTKSNPAKDIYGISAYIKDKHWGCQGALIIDARIKDHHAPELQIDPSFSKKVREKLFNISSLKKYLQS